MKFFLKKTWVFLELLFKSIVSCVLIIIFSSIKVAIHTKKCCLKEKKGSKIIVLGNGPSLKKVLEQGFWNTNIDCMALNSFVISEWFWKLKPKYYYLADDAFWNPTNERTKKISSDFIENMNKVSWPIELYIPTQKNIKNLKEKLTNTNVSFCRMNTIQVDGFKCFRNFIYRIYMGAPNCQTVLNMTLVSAINKGYKTIYLYGADHSWTKDLSVNENNEVIYGDRHVYNTNLTATKLDKKIGDLLSDYANMFKSHYIIRTYADSVNCKIINCTEGSFVDAYERE